MTVSTLVLFEKDEVKLVGNGARGATLCGDKSPLHPTQWVISDSVLVPVVCAT